VYGFSVRIFCTDFLYGFSVRIRTTACTDYSTCTGLNSWYGFVQYKRHQWFKLLSLPKQFPCTEFLCTDFLYGFSVRIRTTACTDYSTCTGLNSWYGFVQYKRHQWFKLLLLPKQFPCTDFLCTDFLYGFSVRIRTTACTDYSTCTGLNSWYGFVQYKRHQWFLFPCTDFLYGFSVYGFSVRIRTTACTDLDGFTGNLPLNDS
jgi:hypothetical protein